MTPALAPRALRNVVVVDTKAVPGPDRLAIAHYEIHVAPDHGRDAKPTVLLTPDFALYEQALLAEGLDRRFDARVRRGTRQGRPCQVLEALVEPTP